ncbi:membrane protein [Microbacterium phage Jemerald]|nr:membrane protein [Microbacterium phage Juicer]WNO27264.1 membrane protein [Microbacterium phage Jemerald]
MTKPIKVISAWERFKRLTVWHPINTDPNDAYRDGPRFWYPMFDVMMIALGVYAYLIGSPLLNRLFPVWFVDSLGVSIIAAAALAGIGAVFPKLFLVELLGKLGLVFFLGGYAGTVAVLSKVSDPNGFVVITLFSLVWLLGPRLSWLFRRLGEWWATTPAGQRSATRRAERAQKRAQKRAKR